MILVMLDATDGFEKARTEPLGSSGSHDGCVLFQASSYVRQTLKLSRIGTFLFFGLLWKGRSQAACKVISERV
jgi:hypothetical protein